MAIVRKFIRNPEIVKDLTQEIFIRAYLNYDYYTETGKIKSWLSVIANNKLKNYYKAEQYRNRRVEFLSLDDFIPVNSNPEETPENIAGQKDFTEQIIKIINTLPQKQRDAVFYSVIYNYSENEIAALKNIPVGSVKSAKHYGLEKVKKLIIQNNLTERKANNNMSKLNKQEAYALLYQYAKGHISNEDKTAVEEYIKTDEESANIVSALKELHPKLTYAREDEMTHYNIHFKFNGGSITYSNVSCHIEDYKEMNEYLEKYDGYTPPDGHWFEMGSDKSSVAVFDNEGNKLEMNTWYPDENNKSFCRQNVIKMKKVFYPVHWKCAVYYNQGKLTMLEWYEKLKEASNLYKGQIRNTFGNNTTVKSALYLAIPGQATNIRMIRGNGVLDCGKYNFIYTDRYVMGEETNIAECTFNM